MPSPLALLLATGLVFAVPAAATTTAVAPAPGRLTVNFNPDWRFLRADARGAAAPEFDDSAWTPVSAPHTFNDTDTFDNWSLPGHRGEQEQWSGRTWYRKSFTAPAEWRGRRVFIEFEAVRQVAEVWLNGVRLGTAKSGFTPFGFDLTPHLRPGASNVLAVMADNRFQKDPPAAGAGPQAATTAATHPNLAQLSRDLMAAIPNTLEELQASQIPWNNPHWHPAHGGIYRNVRLIVTDPVHFTLPLYSFLQTEGPYVYARAITADAATVGFEVPVQNSRPDAVAATVRVEVFDAAGRSVLAFAHPVNVSAGHTGLLRASAPLPHPRWWEPGDPHVYRVALALSVDGTVVDQTSVPLGIRQVRWDAQTGLWINGAHYKLHGWGQKATSEWPGLGAAQPDWLQAYTLQLMHAAGGNFVRWGHVAGGPAQIAAADQLGLVTLQPGVDGEHDTVGGAWALRAATFRDVLIYYRNHPSILIWEGGNQKISRLHAAELRALLDRYDPHGGRAYVHRRADAITAAFMEVGIGTEGGREIARLPVVEGECFPKVAFAPGELEAVAFDPAGAVAATTAKATAGPPVALRLTPHTAPGGWRADGADVALFDVEAVDAAGRRAPTVQTRVDFAVEGPAVWRGGYNSGRAGSINLTHLDLEAGINRVALRSTRTPGRARADSRHRRGAGAALRRRGTSLAGVPAPGPPPTPT